MSNVNETRLPGVGVRHEYINEAGQSVGVITHHDGRREVVVYDSADPDACASLLTLTRADSQTLAELLGASHVTETVAAVQHQIDGLAIEWIHVTPGTAVVGQSIRDGEYRTRTGASIVAVMRGDTSVPAPDPEFVFDEGDVVVAVGTAEGLAALRSFMAS